MLKIIYRRFMLWLIHTKVYNFAMGHIIPFIRFSLWVTKFRGWKYLQAYALLRRGDIILTVDKAKGTSFIIPGEFSHLAVCIDVGSFWEISEMTHHGYTKSTFFDLCHESSRIMIIRCPRITDDREYLEQFIANVKSYDGAKYDNEFLMEKIKKDFKLGIPALYCSELSFVSDTENRFQVSTADLAGLGRQYISPIGYLNGKCREIIYDSDAAVRPSILPF